jgi:hypothetical protein
MGLLLKIALLGLAIYAVWKTYARWKGLYDRFVGKPDEPARPAPPPPQQAQTPPPQPPKRIVEDAQTCSVCGTFFAAGAGKCGQPNCPLP